MPRVSNSVTLVCNHCKKEYKKPKSRAEKSKFCSKACKDAASKKKVKKNCLSCNCVFETTTSKKYCTRACYLKDNKLERIDLKCNFYGPTSRTDIIRKSIANVFNQQGGLRDSDVSIETITITPTPTNVGPDSDFGFNETITFNFDSAAV